MPPPFEEVLTQLKDVKKTMPSALVAELSHLTTEEARLLDKVWPEIEAGRRRHLMEMLVEMAEENPKLDFEAIFRSRLRDPDETVRNKAVEGLWENEDTSLVNTFIDMMQKDSSAGVQASAAQNLGRFALMAEFGKLRPEYKERISKALITILDDEHRPIEVRRRALESMAPLNLPQTRPAIGRAYSSGNSKLKISAVNAMGKTCDPIWLSILLKEIDNPDAEIRYEVCQALGEIGEAEAVPHLALHTRDADTEVQLAAITALGKIGGSEAKECLKKCLSINSEPAKDAARSALDELESDENPFSLRS